jgi:sterol desaturase/sphingolipid hydroxylase (fatty acid hydroxylase superfamily)
MDHPFAFRPWVGLAFLAAMFVVLLAAELLWPFFRGRPEPAGRIAVNVAFGMMNAALASLLPLSTVVPALWAAAHGIGLLHLLAPPFALAAAATLLVRSLSTYFIHRLSHAVPWFWRVHRVHHADTALDLSTGLRNHPLELAIVAPLLAAVTMALGLDPATLLVYEAVALPFALWTHANLRLPARLDRCLRWLLVTPAMHHLHHSNLRREADANYGDVVSLWDRAFGTYYSKDAAEVAVMGFGLGDDRDEVAHRLPAQIVAPFRR